MFSISSQTTKLTKGWGFVEYISTGHELPKIVAGVTVLNLKVAMELLRNIRSYNTEDI